MKAEAMTTILQIGDARIDRSRLAEVCRRYGVRELAYFGSAARGQMTPDSDIDILVDFIPESTIDLVDYAGLMLDLTQLAGRRVDLVSKKGLKPSIRASVLNEAKPLYAA